MEIEFTISLPRPVLPRHGGGSGKLMVCYREGKVTRVRLIGKALAISVRGISETTPFSASSRLCERSPRSPSSRQDARAPSTFASSKRDARLERRLEADFLAYFSGKRVEFDYPVDVEGFTPFQKAVWAAMREIPYGQTRSYRWIAEKVGRPRAYRAVGNACGKNPLLIIQPCHRVVGSQGRLGGFSAGLELKEALLQLEGVGL